MFSEGDDNQGVVLGVVFGVIALVIGLVIGLGIYKTRMSSAGAVALTVPAGTERIAVGPVVIGPGVAATPGAVVRMSVVKIYFDPGRSALPVGTTQAMADIAQEVARGKSLVISGYHDATGNAAQNAELARQRTVNVRDLLVSLGVMPERIDMQKPIAMQTAGSGDAEARRVEVVVQ